MRGINRKVLTAALAVALAGSFAVGAVHSSAATAAGADATYLVLAPEGNPTATATARVAAAGGTVVAAYPQIGVLVAHSTDPDFATAASGAGVEAVASTTGLGTPLEEDETLQMVSSTAQEATGNPTGEPLWGQQWDMTQIDVAEAHAVTTGSPNVVVGVLDTGISSTHPDLATQIAKDKSASCLGGVVNTAEAAWNPTTSSHGTHVAGTIAAAINGVGIAGVAPGVKVASVKVVTDAGFIYPEAAVCGFVWAADHGIQITNNSYFIDPWFYWCSDGADQQAGKEAVARAMRWSEARGVVSAAAAGNENTDLANKTTDPGSPDDSTAVIRPINNDCLDIPTELPGVATAASTTRTVTKSSFSNYGLGVIDVAAPGSSVLSTWPGGGYVLLSGTSMASPHVAGVLALLKSTHPHATPAKLLSLLRQEADDLACPVADARCTGTTADNAFFGEGIADALAAVS